LKLFHSPTSPYVRKVMACAIARGIDGQIELIPTNPHESPPELLAQNPLSKVPCLITDDGMALFDSRVICAFLDTVEHVTPLFPQGGAGVQAVLQQAIGDGICDAAVLRRMEQGRPREDARDAQMARHRAAVERALDVLEADPPAQHLAIGTIAIGCALGYLDLRFASENWREGRPALAAWAETFMAQPCMAQTEPPPGV
jgi:glutathione S-transferase